jgi:Flp pilus assembly protein protease CpaA
MIPWLACLATLGLATWCDVRTRRIPAWLPVVPMVALAAAFDPAPGGFWPALLALSVFGAALSTLICAAVGMGDVALLIPLALVLGPWVGVLLGASLASGVWVIRRTGRSDGPFVPHLLAGFLLASGARWALGG